MTPSDTANDAQRMKALDSALAQIKKTHGPEALADMSKPRKVAALPSGVLPLDIALGIGGIAEGRIIEIFGPESSGKTTLCYHLMAEVQRRGETAAFIDTEHAMDALYAKQVGVDVEKLIVSQPDFGEQALQIAEVLTQSGAVKLIVIDSVAALVPKAELEGNMGDSSVGQLARMMSQACRKIAGQASRTGTTIVFTNQIREKIGVMFGSPETQPGGRALKFFSSQRLDIRRKETVKEGQEAVANRVRVKIVKNKVAPPFTEAEFEIVFGVGVDRYASLIDFGQEEAVGLVEKGGSYYTFTTTGDKVQGKGGARKYLIENPQVADEIENKVREHFFSEGAEEGDEEGVSASPTEDDSQASDSQEDLVTKE